MSESTITNGLTCPDCGGRMSVTRTENVNGAVQRRRKCSVCNANFTTREKFVNSTPVPDMEQIAAFSIARTLKELGILNQPSSQQLKSDEN